MSDFSFSSNFWSWWVILLTVGNILACWWLISWATKKRAGEAATGDVTGHTWDENLEEYNNPLPRWWLWLFYITLVFALVYLAMFPGLGKYQGFLGWTEEKQYDQEMAAAQDKYGPIYDAFAKQPVAQLANDEDAVKTGRRLFLNHCATCHGSDAHGGPGFPNLADNDWLWGGAPDTIKTTIAHGRQAAMPAWGEVLGDDGVKAAAEYVMSLSGRSGLDQDLVAKGEQLFNTYCVACHGADGKGNQTLGAPNLTDKTWLYGSTRRTIMETIAKGRNGKMPAQQEFLGPEKVHLLAAYVYSLSH